MAPIAAAFAVIDSGASAGASGDGEVCGRGAKEAEIGGKLPDCFVGEDCRRHIGSGDSALDDLENLGISLAEEAAVIAEVRPAPAFAARAVASGAGDLVLLAASLDCSGLGGDGVGHGRIGELSSYDQGEGKAGEESHGSAAYYPKD
jgi:hypothetical protein